MTADSRQVELVAVRTQIDELKGRVGDAEKEFTATQIAARPGARANPRTRRASLAKRAAASKI